ncbi:MAG: ribbon-helix-helix domain-containing protein [Hyphomicrobiales bacterium]
MSARPRKRSVMVAGHRTSLSLEDAFWKALHEVAAGRGVSVPVLVEQIDKTRAGASLSGAIRVYLLEDFRRRARTAPAD